MFTNYINGLPTSYTFIQDNKEYIVSIGDEIELSLDNHIIEKLKTENDLNIKTVRGVIERFYIGDKTSANEYMKWIYVKINSELPHIIGFGYMFSVIETIHSYNNIDKFLKNN